MAGTWLTRWRVLLLVLPAVALAEQRPHHKVTDEPQVLAPGYSALQFPAPEVGSYSLPSIGPAADGELLDSRGDIVNLHELYGGKTIVLSFIYTSCPDVNGCPLATGAISIAGTVCAISSESHAPRGIVT